MKSNYFWNVPNIQLGQVFFVKLKFRLVFKTPSRSCVWLYVNFEVTLSACVKSTLVMVKLNRAPSQTRMVLRECCKGDFTKWMIWHRTTRSVFGHFSKKTEVLMPKTNMLTRRQHCPFCRTLLADHLVTVHPVPLISLLCFLQTKVPLLYPCASCVKEALWASRKCCVLYSGSLLILPYSSGSDPTSLIGLSESCLALVLHFYSTCSALYLRGQC